MEPILVEQHLAPVRRAQIERLHLDDRVRGTDLDAQLAELARVQLEREGLRIVALLALEHLDLDHRRRADELAQAAADAVLFPGVLVVGEGEQAAEPIRRRPRDRRVVYGHGLPEQVEGRDPHAMEDGHADGERLGERTLVHIRHAAPSRR